ncbi:Hypothetical predicted protein [Olea europaea subsp. europaea]|uniref:Uncharacterized protein n=1 Tax=Olea europaea subsp. europaea TaxID=158383 RepID=A0A8S0TS47_OLEEU|nr:Hypothetical predicted protein [Olea europaea subsp. europaea]
MFQPMQLNEDEAKDPSKLKVVEQQFNSTLQSWDHSIHQLCNKVPDFIVPFFIPMSMESNANEKDDAIEYEENNFDDEHDFNEDQQHI